MKTPRKICALGIDYGLKNIGLAYGQSLTQTAQALPAIKAKDGIPNWEQMEQVLSQWQPDIVVIGLPLNMDGSESELCKLRGLVTCLFVFSRLVCDFLVNIHTYTIV